MLQMSVVRFQKIISKFVLVEQNVSLDISYNIPPGSHKNLADYCFVCGEFIPLGSLRQICESYAFKNRHFS